MNRSLIASVSLLALAACADQSPSPVAALGGAPVLTSANAIDGQYIVVLNEGANPRSVAAVAGVSPRYVYTATVNGFAATLNAGQVNALQHNPNVAYLEQDAAVTASTIQTGATWGLDRIDQASLPLSTTFSYVNTGLGVTAYIVDTGIRLTHTQFTGRVSSGYDAVDGGSADDCNGHGTHVAGTVGGTTVGVAKGVSLVAVRVLDCAGSGTTSGVIAGVDWVGNNAVKPAVANLSLGGGASTALDNAVTAAINKGVTFVVAAGNGNTGGKAQPACNYSPARVPAAMRERHEQHRRQGLVRQLRHLRGHLRPGQQHPLRLVHGRHGRQHHQRHLDGVAARGGRGRAVPAEQHVRFAGHGEQRPHRRRDAQQGDGRRHGLAQPPAVHRVLSG